MPNRIHPGTFWKDVMVEAGVSQTDVARSMGISEKHMSQIVRGHAVPSAHASVLFARVLHASARLVWQVSADWQLWEAIKKVDEGPEVPRPRSRRDDDPAEEE